MSELGSGSGSSYPSTLDTNNTLEVNSPNAGKTKARAEVPNDSMAAIIAIQTELGTDPAGTTTDVKTFLQTEHGVDGTHTAVTATSLTVSGTSTLTGILTPNGGIQTDGANSFKVKIVDIGDWDMDATGSINVAHGLTQANIRSVDVVIRWDDDSLIVPLNRPENVSVYAIQGGIIGWTATNVNMGRLAGGYFDTTDFNATSFNRGWVTIIYTV